MITNKRVFTAFKEPNEFHNLTDINPDEFWT